MLTSPELIAQATQLALAAGACGSSGNAGDTEAEGDIGRAEENHVVVTTVCTPVSELVTDIATPGTRGVLAVLAAGLLNMFVPSGGESASAAETAPWSRVMSSISRG